MSNDDMIMGDTIQTENDNKMQEQGGLLEKDGMHINAANPKTMNYFLAILNVLLAFLLLTAMISNICVSTG